jgi:glutathione S-transferase
MRLYSSPTSPFARKARVIAHELGIKLEEVQTNPVKDEAYRRVNPLSKVPALVLDDGSVLIDSPVICEYLNARGGGKFFPGASIWRDNTGRWKSLGLQALADGLMEAVVAVMRERRREPKDPAFEARNLAAVNAALDALERSKFSETPTIGEIATGCALGYVDFRLADLDWRASRPKLTAWYEKFSLYPSMQATKPQ